jgi:hypothetical protein
MKVGEMKFFQPLRHGGGRISARRRGSSPCRVDPLGGASGAEICALEAFRADPSLHAMRAATREVYGEPPALPPDAVVLFSGVDPKVGKLTKYAWKEPHVDTR